MSGMENFAVLLLTGDAPTNETISFCLQTKNSNGLISEFSNVVKVQLGEFSQPPIIDPTDIIIPIDNGLSQTTIRAIVGGSVLGVFVLICIAFLAYNSAKKIRGPRARDIPKSECLNHGFADSTKDLKNINTRDSLSKENDTRNYSAKLSDAPDDPSNKIDDTREGSSKKHETIPVVLYTHDQIRHIKEKTNTPPLYGANVGPKPWLSLDSLSRKLNKEEDNKSEDSASTLPANETDYAAEEVKQFSDNAHTFELPVEKVAKF
ncbi:hypothetical protein JTE90_008378 [Oedothorax gibbosus]|uniref:Uncharacterized protein n=1 Tax=Oedothorax gibbosus TaxID=931172 RepID=A0AAV6V555_9ARAC|nr:hypothetical protein JTE90_008378 [Oedothorax gibbosus]